MEDKYNRIRSFFEEYIHAYSEYGQSEDTISVMNRFYAPDLCFPDDMVNGRDQWYVRCLNHPSVQDRLSIEHLIIDERQNEVSALLKTEAIDTGTGAKLMELRMSALYTLRMDSNEDMKIETVRLMLESNPEKVARLAQLYRIGM